MSRRGLRVLAGVLVTLLALIGGGAVVLNGSDCENGPCEGAENFTISERAMLADVGVCAIVEQRGHYSSTYRTTLLGEHRRYLSAQVVPGEFSVRFTASCGDERPVQVQQASLSTAWTSRLRDLEWARDTLGADVASMADNDEVFTATVANASTMTLSVPTPQPVTFTRAARAGFSEPVAFGDVVVNVTTGSGSGTRNQAVRVVKVKIYPRTGPAAMPTAPRR